MFNDPLEALKFGGPRIRVRAAMALGEDRRADAVALLSSVAVSDEKMEVREAAIKALAQIGGESAKEGLVQALPQPSLDLTLLVAGFLGSLGWQPTTPGELVNVLLANPDWLLRSEADKLSDALKLEVILALATYLGSHDKKLRRSSEVALLGLLSRRSSREPSMSVPEDSLGCRLALVALAEKSANTDLLESMLGLQDVPVLTRTIDALGRMRGRYNGDTLLPLLLSADRHVLRAAAVSLEQLGRVPTNGEQVTGYLAGLHRFSEIQEKGGHVLRSVGAFLGDGQPSVVVQAAATLCRLVGVATLAELTGLLDHPSQSVRTSAGLMLVGLGHEAVRELQMAACSDIEPAALAATCALSSKLSQEDCRLALAEVLQSGLGRCRRMAVRVLSPVATLVDLSCWTSALEDGQLYVRLRALRVVSELAEPAATRPLLNLLERFPDRKTRRLVVGAIRKALASEKRGVVVEDLLAQGMSGCGPGNYVAALVLSTTPCPEWKASLLKLLDSRSADVRRVAARALRETGGLGDVGAICGALANNDNYVRYTAAAILTRLGDSGVADELLNALKNEHDDKVRAAIRRALLVVCRASTLPIVKALRNPHYDAKGAVVDLLRELKWQPDSTDDRVIFLVAQDEWGKIRTLGPQAVAALSWLLSNPEHGAQAALAIAGIGGELAIASLAEGLAAGDTATRVSVLKAMITLPDSDSRRRLLQMAALNSIEEVRELALSRLLQEGQPPTTLRGLQILIDQGNRVVLASAESRELLRTALESPEPRERLRAVELMGQAPSRDLIPMLAACATDTNASVKAIARWAMRRCLAAGHAATGADASGRDPVT